MLDEHCIILQTDLIAERTVNATMSPLCAAGNVTSSPDVTVADDCAMLIANEPYDKICWETELGQVCNLIYAPPGKHATRNRRHFDVIFYHKTIESTFEAFKF